LSENARLARVFGLRLRRSPGLANCPGTSGTSARPSHPGIESRSIRWPGQWHAPKNFRLTVARRRRFFTVFPCAESPR